MLRRILWLGLIFCTLSAWSCCNQAPNAIIFDTAHPEVWFNRLYSNNPNFTPPIGNDTSIDAPVFALLNYQEYRYKLGEQFATDCSDVSGYSAWTARTVNLQASYSSMPDTLLALCIQARGVDQCGTLLTQAVPTQYRWYKDTAITNFSITGPAGLSNSLAQTVVWTASDTDAKYDLTVSQSTDGSNPIQTYLDLTTTTQQVTLPADGTYYLFAFAKDQAGNRVGATNNGASVTVDTAPPGSFAIMAPTGTISTLSPMVELQNSAGAAQYHAIVANAANCAAGTIVDEDTGATTSIQMSVPSAGTYYVCAEALDNAGNNAWASNSGAQFTVVIQQQEVIVKDHVSDAACWNSSNDVLYHYNDPAQRDGIVASGFTGQGGILKRVGGIFADSDCSIFNNGLIQNMETSVAFYESAAVFLADPYLQNQPPGSTSVRVTVPKLHTDPLDPLYFLNPVRITSSGTQEFFIEVDVSSFNIQTTLGQQHLVALWFSSTNASDGTAWMALSDGCTGQVGAEPDYYRSENEDPALGPGTLQSLGAAGNNAAYLVTELQ